MPNTVYISAVIDAPVERVWAVMRDYNGMPSYHPGMQHSLIEDGRPSDQVGCVRRLTLAEEVRSAKSCSAWMTGITPSPTKLSRALCRFATMWLASGYIMLLRVTAHSRSGGLTSRWWGPSAVLLSSRSETTSSPPALPRSPQSWPGRSSRLLRMHGVLLAGTEVRLHRCSPPRSF